MEIIVLYKPILNFIFNHRRIWIFAHKYTILVECINHYRTWIFANKYIIFVEYIVASKKLHLRNQNMLINNKLLQNQKT